MNTQIILSSLLLASLLLAMHQVSQTECQLLDKIFNSNANNRNANVENEISDGKDLLAEQRQQGFGPIVQRIMGALNVNVPGFYDMTKNGSSMGINVLSGLVRVDRGKEAERSGLQGPRPLSVRVFGIPVYERGARVGGGSPGILNPGPSTGNNTPPGSTVEDEELPIEP